MAKWPSGEDICRAIKAGGGPTTMITFSRGKDSIGTWLQIRRHFDRIIAYHLESVPGLEFVEESLQYYERFFDTHIIRIPHSGFYDWLNGFTYQPPHRATQLAAMQLPKFNFLDIHNWVARDQGLDPNRVWTACGLKAADTLYRRVMIDAHGPISRNQRKFYPIYDWNADRLFTEIEKAGCKLPVDYLMYGRSLDGLQYAFIKPIKDRFPRDYAKIVEWFPLVEAEIWRYEHGKGAVSNAA